VLGVGRVSLINKGDPYSHLRVDSLACLAKSYADTADYPLALRRALLLCETLVKCREYALARLDTANQLIISAPPVQALHSI